MALNPIVLLAGAAAAYLLTKKTPAPTTATTTKKDEKPAEEKLHDTDEESKGDDSPLPELPQIDEDDQTLPDVKDDEQDEDIKINLNMDKFFAKYLLNNGEKPASPTKDTIWVSKTCNSWAIGKDFKLLLPEKYVFSDTKNPENKISPVDWWNKTGGDISPAPIYFANLEADISYRSWAKNIIQYYTSCGKDIPNRKDYPNYAAFDIALKKFEITPIGQLYRFLYRAIADIMLKNWEQQYPDASIKEDLKWNSLWAIRKYPKLSQKDTAQKAYDYAFFTPGNVDLNAPKKIDPKNPAHKPYMDAWNYMYFEIKSLKDFIKNWGDFEDPLA